MFGYENTELPRAAGGGQHHPPGPQRGAGRRALQVGAADRAVGGDGDGRVQGRNPAGLVARPRQPLLHDHLDEGRHPSMSVTMWVASPRFDGSGGRLAPLLEYVTPSTRTVKVSGAPGAGSVSVTRRSGSTWTNGTWTVWDVSSPGREFSWYRTTARRTNGA